MMGLLQLHAVMRLFLKLSCELLGMNLSNGCSTSCEAGASFFRFSFITSFELHKSGLDLGFLLLLNYVPQDRFVLTIGQFIICGGS